MNSGRNITVGRQAQQGGRAGSFTPPARPPLLFTVRSTAVQDVYFLLDVTVTVPAVLKSSFPAASLT